MLFGGGAGRSSYSGPPPGPETVDRIRELCLNIRKRPDPLQLLEDHCFVVLDTETTGFMPRGGDEIISLGAVKLEQGRIRPDTALHRLVNPFRPIPPEITRLTGIGPDMVDGKDDVFTVIAEFLEYAQSCVLIGHYITFDLDFINEKLSAFCGIKLRPSVLDTCVISRAMYPRRASHSLDNLLKYHSIEPKGRHTALGDALLTANLFLTLLARTRDKGVRSLGDLHIFVEQHLDYYYQVGFRL